MTLSVTLSFVLLGVASAYAGRRRAGPSPPPGPPPPPPPLKGNILYHLFERKYTGLGNKDAGDFLGDMNFIFKTFSAFEETNPEASMDANIIEMSEVNVTGWGTYEACNAPGCTGRHTCPANRTVYCCTPWGPGANSSGEPIIHNKTTLPGTAVPHNHSPARNASTLGNWFSFPMEAEGTTWTQRLIRRINGKCLGDAWRKDAGGCSSCGEALDECVAKCIQSGPNGTTALLKKTWDRVFSDPKECPEVPFPGAETVIV